MKSPSTFFTTPVLCAAVLAFTVAPIHAQSARYLRIALGSAQLEPPSDEFRLSSVRYPSVALGWTSSRGHGVELSVSHLDAETTEPRNPLSEGPYTVGIRATTIDVAYSYQLLLWSGRVRPRLGLGVAVMPVVDRWRSDTPTESAGATIYGASASVGLTARVWGAASAIVRAAYQFADDGGDSRIRRVGLAGSRLEAGLEIAF
jgi:hypothetical protein